MAQKLVWSSRSNLCPLFHSFKTWSGPVLFLFCFFLVVTCDDSPAEPRQGDAHWATDPAKDNSVTANWEPHLNDPCDYRMYVDFNDEVAENKHSKTPYNKAVGKKYNEHPHATQSKPKIMDPKNLCIRTDAQKNIDVNEFDCLPDKIDIEQVKGYCGCGSRWSQIDLNDDRSYRGLNVISHSVEYQALNGLDKFLVLERNGNDSECVASRFGHCTLDQFKQKPNWIVTKCQKGFKCRNVSVWSPIQKTSIYNQHSGEWYGLCISEKTPDGLKDPFSASAKVFANMSSIFAIVSVTLIILTCQTSCFDNPESNKRQNNKCHPKFIC